MRRLTGFAAAMATIGPGMIGPGMIGPGIIGPGTSAAPAFAQQASSAAVPPVRTVKRPPVATPTELPPELARSLVSALSEQSADRKLAKFRALLPSLEAPSSWHLIASMQVGQLLAEAGRTTEARDHFAGTIVTYPDTLGVKLGAVYALAYTNEAQVAARWWTELAASDAKAARAIDGYTLDALMGNLSAQDHLDTRAALLLALDRIGYEPGSAQQGEALAFAVFENAAPDPARSADAQRALSRLDTPELVQRILARNTYAAYWSDIAQTPEAWRERAKRLVAARRAELREEDTGPGRRMLLGALCGFGDPAHVVAVYGPEMDRLLAKRFDPQTLDDLSHWAAQLARAYELAETPDAAKSFYRRVERAVAPYDGVNRINVTANHAKLLVDSGDALEGLLLIEPALAEMEELRTALNGRYPMIAVRVLALDALGRLDEATQALASLEAGKQGGIGTYVDTMVRLGRSEAAAAALTAQLSSRDPDDALAFLQPPLANRLTVSGRFVETSRRAMLADASVRAALSRVGRLVPVDPITLTREEAGY